MQEGLDPRPFSTKNTQTARDTNSLSDRATALALGGLLLLYILSAAIGVILSLVGYTSTDSCWLLKLGRLMLTSHAIPRNDPLSFTLPLLAQSGHAQPFIIYQWLSEILFALSLRLFNLNLNGPLVLCAVATASAAISVLFRVCLRARCSLLLSATLVCMTVGSIALRLMVRPEIFTLVLISVWLGVLHRIRGTGYSPAERLKIDRPAVIGSAAIMLIWCNVHSGFVIGIISLAIYTASLVLQNVGQKKALRHATKTALACLFASCLISLINPWGIQLWTYLPQLFFSPINLSARETQAVGLRELNLLAYYPFFILLGLSLFASWQTIRATAAELKVGEQGGAQSLLSTLVTRGQMLSILMIIVAAITSLCCKRLIAPLSLFLAAESATLFGSLTPLARPLPALLKGKKMILTLELPVMLFAALGVFLSSDRIAPLTLPQPSAFFQPSFPAMEYVLDHWQGGHVFNNIQIGSMLTMYGPAAMKVFVDTRLDAYGEKLLHDYWTIIQAQEDYQRLLDAYQIDWVIVTPKDELADALKSSPSWRKEFEDADAVIFARNEQAP